MWTCCVDLWYCDVVVTEQLTGVYPPIEKMEGPLHILVNCEKLSLSTNLIVNIQNLQVRALLHIWI